MPYDPLTTTLRRIRLNRYSRAFREHAARIADQADRLMDEFDALMARAQEADELMSIYHRECAQPGCPERRVEDESFCQGHALSWIFG